MKTSNVITAPDDINRINELQDSLQFVVDKSDSTSIETCNRIILVVELYLSQTTPLLQNLTNELTTIQMYLSNRRGS